MRTTTSIFAGLAFSALLTFGAQAQEPVRLGFLSSLSGTFGVLGAEQKRGLDLALEHLGNKLGGRPVTLIEVDDKSNPVEAADLAAVDRVLKHVLRKVGTPSREPSDTGA